MQAPKKKPYAAYLTVWCPTTQSSISTTIATDVRTLTKAWHRKIKVSCPHCREIHNYRVSEAFVEAALSNAHLRGELTIINDPNPLLPPASPQAPLGS
jgi:phage FluMu protein Com